MLKYIVTFILGGVFSLSLFHFVYNQQPVKISSDKIPSAPFNDPGRYYIGTCVRHLDIGEKDGRRYYKFESWIEDVKYTGFSTIGSADDWNANDHWWIHSEDGEWFWIFDGSEDLRLLRFSLHSTGSHAPQNYMMPESVKAKLPSKLVDVYSKKWRIRRCT